MRLFHEPLSDLAVGVRALPLGVVTSGIGHQLSLLTERIAQPVKSAPLQPLTDTSTGIAPVKTRSLKPTCSTSQTTSASCLSGSSVKFRANVLTGPHWSA